MSEWRDREAAMELDEWLQCDEIRAFAQWFEESVVSKMPVGLAASYMAVLNKA